MAKRIVKIKYSTGDKVKLVTGNEVFIDSVNIFTDFITYRTWDGKDFNQVEEWKILEKVGKKRSIGFEVHTN